MQESYDKREKNWVLGITALPSFMMALDAMIITTGCHYPQRFRRYRRDAAMDGQRL